MKVERRKQLTRAEWTAITSGPGQGPVVRRVLSGRMGQLAPEGPSEARQRDFGRRLTDDTKASEEGSE